MTAGTEPVDSRLRRMPAAHVLRLVQNGRKPTLFDRSFQMKPRQVAAALGDFRQSVAAHANDRQWLAHGAQLRHELDSKCRDGVAAHDGCQASREMALRRLAQLAQIADQDRLQVQKTQQRLESVRLRICGLDHNNFAFNHYLGLLPNLKSVTESTYLVFRLKLFV